MKDLEGKKVVVVISGGMDSVTLLYKVIAEGAREVKAISFDYGQRHAKELLYAKATCNALGVSHTIVDLSSITKLISNSALTGDIEVPHGHYEAENMKLTVVPGRNTIMAAIAMGYAVNLDYDIVALGVHAGDHAIYPDCRPAFIAALDRLMQLANFKSIRVYAPFQMIDKADIAMIGKELNVDYSKSWTCYEGGEMPCKKCGSCQERAYAFEKAGMKDPLLA